MILPCYIVFTYFASFTGYEDAIFEVVSNLHVEGSKFGGKLDKFGEKSFKKLNSAEYMEFVFSKSAYISIVFSVQQYSVECKCVQCTTVEFLMHISTVYSVQQYSMQCTAV